MRTWYRIQNAADDPTVVDIHIIDFIGDWIDDALNRIFNESIGVTARQFVDDLSKLPAAVKTIRVHINSPGGDVHGAVNIANALREQQTSKARVVETVIDGLAASAASIIAMAGSVVRMADNALVMVHQPWTVAVGNAAEMRKTAGVLDTFTGQVVATYQWHSKLSVEELTALMDAETWMNADEAIANGFATEKVAGLSAAASIDPRAASRLKVPDVYRDRVNAWLKPAPASPPAPPAAAAAADVLRVCREGGCLDLAEGLIAVSATLDDVTARVNAEKQTRATAAERATQIRALCSITKLPELADGYIQGAMPLDAIRAHLTTLTAKIDSKEIDGSLPADQGGRTKPRLIAAEIYNERNGVTTKKE